MDNIQSAELQSTFWKRQKQQKKLVLKGLVIKPFRKLNFQIALMAPPLICMRLLCKMQFFLLCTWKNVSSKHLIIEKLTICCKKYLPLWRNLSKKASFSPLVFTGGTLALNWVKKGVKVFTLVRYLLHITNQNMIVSQTFIH